MIFTKNGTRINIYAPFVYQDVQYPNLLDPALRARFNILEVQEPFPPEGYDPDLYYKTEQDAAPYIIYTKKSDEQINQVLLSRLKVARTAAVDNLKVTINNKEFDADETSQNRMSRAINGMSDTDTLPWVLADNSITTVTKSELVQALREAGIAMATEWLKPYQP